MANASTQNYCFLGGLFSLASRLIFIKASHGLENIPNPLDLYNLELSRHYCFIFPVSINRTSAPEIWWCYYCLRVSTHSIRVLRKLLPFLPFSPFITVGLLFILWKLDGHHSFPHLTALRPTRDWFLRFFMMILAYELHPTLPQQAVLTKLERPIASWYCSSVILFFWFNFSSCSFSSYLNPSSLYENSSWKISPQTLHCCHVLLYWPVLRRRWHGVGEAIRHSRDRTVFGVTQTWAWNPSLASNVVESLGKSCKSLSFLFLISKIGVLIITLHRL